MRNLLKIIGILFLLQIIYYFIFLHSNFIDEDYSYNIASLISVLVLLGWYITRTVHVLKYGIGHIILQIFLAFFIIIVMFGLTSVFSFFGNWVVGTLNSLLYNHESYIPVSSILIQLWQYHLFSFQIIIIVLNIYVYIIKDNNEPLQRRVMKTYKISTLILFLLIILFMIISYNSFYFHFFFIVSIVVMWLFIPVLILLCEAYEHYYAVLIGWCLVAYLTWPFFNSLFEPANGFLWT